MLVCKVEIWPGGDAAQAQLVGELHVSNISGDEMVGDYRGMLMTPHGHREVYLTGFPRRDGGVELARAVLTAMKPLPTPP